METYKNNLDQTDSNQAYNFSNNEYRSSDSSVTNDSTDYSSGNDYASTTSNPYATNNDYTSSENSYTSNYDYNPSNTESYANTGDNANSYSTNSAYVHPGYTEREYLELESEKQTLATEVEKLESQTGTLRLVAILFSVLFLLGVGYIIWSEVEEPFFGKWPQIAQENAQLKSQVADMNALQTQLDSLKAANVILSEQSDVQDGVFFEVQIGAFEHFNMEKYMENLAKLKKERIDVLDKYTLGKFRDHKMAEAFIADIRKMGIADAFVVAKVNGERVDVQEAINASKTDAY